MPLAILPRPVSADDLEPERLIAVAAAGMLVIELVATLAGVRGAVTGVLVFGGLTAICVAAARIRRSGHRRRSSLLVATALLVAVPVLVLVYPERSGMALLGPLAFVFAVPHLHGRALAAFAMVAALATALALARHTATYGGEAATLAGIVTAAYGAVIISTLLYTLTWRSHRSARANDIRFRRLVADLPVGVARCGPDGRFVDVNAAFARLVGYDTPDEVVGLAASSLLADPRDRGRLGEHLLGAGGAGTDEGEIRLRRRDGTDTWAWYRARVERAGDGTARWYDVVVDDVTADRAEREARNLLAAIVDEATDAIFAQGLDGTIITWNDGARAIYGWTREEIVGRSVLELMLPEEHEAHQQTLDLVRAGEVVGPRDVRRVTKDGRPLVVSLTVGPARDADGQIVAAATIGRDITERQRLRAEQAALEAQLRQASKMEAVGRLAGGVAHDFNNLLTTISGYGSLVADGLSGRALEDQQQVLAAAARATELVARLLQFSREAPADPRPVDVDEAIRRAVALVDRLIPASVALDVRLEAEARVVLDVVELEQALLSLVANALDAMPAGGTLTIASGRVPGTGEVAISVCDTGTGMDEAARTHAFEPFFTTKPLGEGVGLGLSSVYGFASRAGGRAELTTSLGTGTTVTVTLPVSPSGGVPAEDDAGPRRWVPTGSERILLVEDDPSVRSLAARILRKARYEVIEAGSPQEALDAAAAGSFDALVSDVVMPGMTGADLAARVCPDLPIVFISGYPGDAMPALGLDLPTRAFISKPFAAVTLVGAVRAVLDAAAAATSAGELVDAPAP